VLRERAGRGSHHDTAGGTATCLQLLHHGRGVVSEQLSTTILERSWIEVCAQSAPTTSRHARAVARQL
jgi:hypothetical protein